MRLTTARLALRELARDDLDFVADMLADPAVMQYYPRVLARTEAEAWIERQLGRYRRDGHGLWLVTERATVEPVGQVGLLRQRVADREEWEIGYLLHRRYWHRGYATEAALAVRDYAFQKLSQPRVISLIRPENAPSRRVAHRLGMQPTAHVEFHGFPHLVFARARPLGGPGREGEVSWT